MYDAQFQSTHSSSSLFAHSDFRHDLRDHVLLHQGHDQPLREEPAGHKGRGLLGGEKENVFVKSKTDHVYIYR